MNRPLEDKRLDIGRLWGNESTTCNAKSLQNLCKISAKSRQSLCKTSAKHLRNSCQISAKRFQPGRTAGAWSVRMDLRTSTVHPGIVAPPGRPEVQLGGRSSRESKRIKEIRIRVRSSPACGAGAERGGVGMQVVRRYVAAGRRAGPQKPA